MLRYVQTGYGAVKDNLKLEEVDMPSPKGGELLIDIHAAALNPIDYKLVRGVLKPVLSLKFPSPMGFDGSGKVVQIGESVRNFKVGDEVFFRASLQSRGSFAEAICIEESLVAIKPSKLSHTGAASLPLVALTTSQGITDRAGAKPGQSILIHAASGGVGSFAVQYAKAIGLEVTAITSSRNSKMVADLGADFVIEYDKEDYRLLDKKFDIIFDTLGKDQTTDSFKLLNVGGSLVSIAGPPSIEMAHQLGLNWFMRMLFKLMSHKVNREAKKLSGKYFSFFTTSDGEQLSLIAKMVENNQIRPIIAKEYKFEDLAQALEYLETSRANGKVVLKLK